MGKSKRWFREICEMDINEINNNFQFLGEGLGRRVYAVDDNYVIKVSKNIEGIYQSNVENYIYRNAGSVYRQYLCPVVSWYDPKVLLMRRAIPLSNYINTQFIDLKTISNEEYFYDDIRELAYTFSLYQEDVLATNSWGIFDNKLVLIDYGCTRDNEET